MKTRVASGIIFIVDISGYSNFVKQISTQEGAYIMPRLLQSLLDVNMCSFRVAEIEGDAILFYRIGAAMGMSCILEQFNRMVHSFHTEIAFLKATYPQISSLTIKVVVHYGLLSGYEIGGFYKLYGKVMVEAHRLLKNHVCSKTYALITNAYYSQQDELIGATGKAMYEHYDIGNLRCTYFEYKEPPQSRIWLA